MSQGQPSPPSAQGPWQPEGAIAKRFGEDSGIGRGWTNLLLLLSFPSVPRFRSQASIGLLYDLRRSSEVLTDQGPVLRVLDPLLLRALLEPTRTSDRRRRATSLRAIQSTGRSLPCHGT